MNSDPVQSLYSRPAMIWALCPLLLYWLIRMVMKSHRGEMTDDPIVFAATDRVSLSVLFACFLLVIAATL